ncbi:uncharacterized protein [Diabrotica undecimpunctata]|uniref:uncharacterized protein n=1 Tax=Diabrotica undecimpunctata TaxID=50387 RepID=UPI003B632FF5
MKQLLIFLVLFISAFGTKLNEYLPPRPESNNAQYQPPAFRNQPFAAASQFQHKVASPNSQQFSRQYLTPNKAEQSTQESNHFGQVSLQYEKPSSQFKHENYFNGNGYSNADKHYITPHKLDAAGQSSNSFGNFQPPNSFNVKEHESDNRNYLTPNKLDYAGQNSNSFVHIQNLNSVNGQGLYPSVGKVSINHAPITENHNSFQPLNQKANSNVQFGHFGSLSSGFHQQSGHTQLNDNSDSQSALIGLSSSEYKSNNGNKHANNLYQSEHQHLAQKQDFVQNEGKTAQAAFPHTYDVSEQISVKAFENNGYDRNIINKYQENVNKVYQAFGPHEQSPFASQENRQVASSLGPKFFGGQNDGYQYSSLSESKNFADQGILAIQQSNKIPSLVGEQGSKSTLGQNSNNEYQYSSPNSLKSNFVDQGTFASQQNQQIAELRGKQEYTKEPKPIFPFSTQFGQKNAASQAFNRQNNGYQYPVPEQSPFSSQQNKQAIPSRPQFAPIPQYGAPEQSSSANQNNFQFNSFHRPTSQVSGFLGNNKFNDQSAFQNKGQHSGTSEQFGTVQDSDGGYKY